MACKNGICEYNPKQGINMAKALKNIRNKSGKSSKKSALQSARSTPRLKDVNEKTISNKVNIKKPSFFKGTNAEHLTYSPYTSRQQKTISNIGELGSNILRKGQPYTNPNEVIENLYNKTQWNNPQAGALQNQLFQSLNPQNLDFQNTADYVMNQFNQRILPQVAQQNLTGLGSVSDSSGYQRAKAAALGELVQSLGRLKEENQFNRLGAQQRSAEIINNYINSQRGLQANVANAVTSARQNTNNEYMNNGLRAAQLGLTPTVQSVMSPAQPANAVSALDTLIKGGVTAAKAYFGGGF